MDSPLISFLSQVRVAVFDGSSAATKSSTLVLGNTSADLDSFIAAVVFSYAYSRDKNHGLFIPIINLPAVPSADLWRLRPEFGTALRLAVDCRATSADGDEGISQNEKKEKSLLQHLITINDLQHHDSTKSWFPTEDSDTPSQPLNLVLVDHNAPAIPGVSSSTISKLKLTGCIDHHEDESKVPSSASPRIIKTGIGSCTSLIVQHLRDQNLWPYSPTETESSAAKELSILSLAPILIDTANLTAPGKVSPTDRQAVSFLQNILASTPPLESLYTQISTSKSTSLDHLTIPEILDRDYKEWTECKDALEIKIGISSSVKPLSYLLSKSLLSSLTEFTASKSLDIYILLTAYTSRSDSFHRELLIFCHQNTTTTTKPNTKAPIISHTLSKFTKPPCSTELGLEPWTGDENLVRQLAHGLGNGREGVSVGIGAVYEQTAIQKSRKQVAPLIRGIVREELRDLR